MPEIEGLVSVVVAAYNAESFLPETLNSVKRQLYTDWEVIVIDDGSKNPLEQAIQTDDQRIRFIRQENSGVSAARNRGLYEAKGEYVVFLDHDDLLVDSFMNVRVEALKSDKTLGFVGGLVETFPEKTALKKAAGENAEKEILFFDNRYATIPSNYLIRKNILNTHNIHFNLSLNSTADRFLILQLFKHTKGKHLPGENGKVLYRVWENSMSRNTKAIVLDNEHFYKELSKYNLLPTQNYKQFVSLYSYSLAMGFVRINYLKSSFTYLLRSFFSSPRVFLEIVLKKINSSLK
jgi:glycosyltransferase involved in cell wall biosynthesis